MLGLPPAALPPPRAAGKGWHRGVLRVGYKGPGTKGTKGNSYVLPTLPQGDDPYPAEGAPGCPSEHSPSGPRKCDADATGDHTSFKADRYTFSGAVQSASGATQIKQMIMEGGAP